MLTDQSSRFGSLKRQSGQRRKGSIGDRIGVREPDVLYAAQQLAAFETFLEAHHQKLEADRERARREAENVEAGPELPSVARAAPGSYGKALLPGEGDAMAAFVQAGKRIPRRGEVGLTSEQISGYENLGYVMSGSRHSRMNAIRIRKENQVYTAEEKAALSMIDFEEKQKKEAKVMADMQKLVSKHLDS